MDDCGQLDRQLYDAVLKGDIERATELLEKGVSVNARDVSDVRTVLMEACLNQNKAIVDLLLKRGAAVNATTRWGKTALMYAAMGGHEEIFDLLIEHSADVMLKDLYGMTIVHLAAAKNNKNILDRLLLMGPRGTHWQLTVDIGDIDARTPLFLAARNGSVDCVDVLLVHGANPEHKSKWSGSPLEIAKECGYETIVSMMTAALTLRSHPYVSGMNAKQERQIKELKREKEQLQWELRQADQQPDQQPEIARLTAEIQQKDSQLKELSSALSSMRKNQEEEEETLKALTRSVLEHGADQWYDLGIELGYKHCQVVASTKDMKRDESKLHALINQKHAELGREILIDRLLNACKVIPYPIYEAVWNDIRPVYKDS